MKMSANKFAAIFFLVLFLPIFAVFLSPEVRVRNCSEQFDQAEVVGKRMKSSSSINGGQYHYSYIVSFKVTDGSVKEIEVGRNTRSAPYCSEYNSLNDGDTGILTYKELKSVEKGFFVSYSYRLFISFEKGPEYGGLKVEMYKRPVDIWKIVLAVIITVLVLPYLIYTFRIELIFNPFMKKRVSQVEVMTQRPKCKFSTNITYKVAFKFPDGSVKELRVTNVRISENSKWDGYIAIKGDTGLLTYKERKNIANKIKDKDKHWKGRHFISFEKDPKSIN